ncbi:MAG TPA: sugar transferase, partial [Bacteroidales bacterium]|nr:sugar transferase [Bacteroidales bacterium]
MVIRFFDLLFATIALVCFSPVLIIIALFILFESKGGSFYKQLRVGKDNKDFYLLKFRTMRVGADKKGLLTVGDRDPRVTRSGFFLRKYKLDELPQLVNVFVGDMSIVGPRPEVRRYVDLYSDHQKRILHVKPGITDYASFNYIDENEILAQSTDPEYTYIHEIMPAKI